MQRVLVLSHNKTPLMPCHPARARELLQKKRAAVYRRYPFTIILKDRTSGATQPVTLKFDPGSKTTGIAMVADGQRGLRVIWAAELAHRGQSIRDALTSRRQIRRSRRNRKARYRPPRFDNRRRRTNWIPPSLQSRVDNIKTWQTRLNQLAPVASFVLELVKFDTQQMQHPEISGIEYQQGELAGYEVREYLLEKWGRKCAYCGATDLPLEIEHIIPRSRNGSNRVSNLTLACHKCNTEKGRRTAAEFGHPEVQTKAKQPLKDTAVVNTTRWSVYRMLQQTGLWVEIGTGGRTKYNRIRQGYPKTHWIDAACVGESGHEVRLSADVVPLQIRAMGRGSRQMCRMDRFGFPRTSAKSSKRVLGFQTGDMVRAVVPSGKKAGTHIGRVAVRSSGGFNVTTAAGTVQGISAKYCMLLHRSDGYNYINKKGDAASSPCVSTGVSAANTR